MWYNYFNMKTKILTILIAVGIALGGFGLFGYPTAPEPTLGDYNPTGAGTYRLQSSVTGTQTTLTLTSFKEPISNIPYTMSYLNSTIEYATIEPQTTNSKEFISFTGVTQNADGTATLTGLSRGLSFSYPFTASTTFQQAHSGQTILILSNPPQLYNQFYNLSNISTSTNILNFSSTSPPRYDQVAAQGTGTYISTTSELASIAYVNAIAISGSSNGTEAVKGIWQGATQIQSASSTILGSTGAGLVQQSRYATSSPGTIGLWDVWTNNAGKIAQSFLDFAQATTWTALHTFTGGLTSTATSTFAGSNVNSNAIIFNTLTYSFPSSRAASSTVLMENGSGSLSFNSTFNQKFYLNTSTTGMSVSQATTTIFAVSVPANTLGTSNAIQCNLHIPLGAGGSAQMKMSVSYGGVASSTVTTGVIGGSGNIYLNNTVVLLSATGATNTQKLSLVPNIQIDAAPLQFGVTESTPNRDSTTAQPLIFTLQFLVQDGTIPAGQVVCTLIR